MTTIHMPSIMSHETFAPEDPMELSLDIDRRQIMEVEIDVDLDLTVERAFEQEDDNMAEDYNLGADQDLFGRPILQVRDDDMLDGEYTAQEAEDILSVPDEQLEDAACLEPEQYHILRPATPVVSELEVNDDLTGDLSPDQELGTPSMKHTQTEFASRLSVTREIDESEQFAQTTQVESREPPFGETPESNYDLNDSLDASNQVTSGELLAPTQTTSQDLGSTWDGPILRVEEDSRFSFPSVADGAAPSNTFLIPNENASTYLSRGLPVTLIYQDTEMSLFPPAEGGQTTYFLSDEALVSQNIENLFDACRNVLAGSIEEEEKLEFSIDDLGLRISEFTNERSTLNLADLINLYFQLQSHDGLENPRPLCLTLRTKFKFSTRWKYLKDQLAEGKGLSQLTPAIKITEEIQPEDLQTDHGQFEQPHADFSKKVSETELRREELDNVKEIDDGSFSPPLFEVIRPDSQHHKANTPAPDLHEGELDMVNLKDRSEYHPTATTPTEASINAQVPNALTGDASHPQLEAAATPDQEYSPSEHGDLIDYDNEGDYDEGFDYPGTSTGSSTIQGDVLETVADRLGRSLNGTTVSEHDDKIAHLTSLESDSIIVQDDQLIVRSISDGKDGDHSGVIYDIENGINWNATTKYRGNRENLKAFNHLDRSEMNLIVESDGYKPASQGTETSNSIRDLQTLNESNDDAGTRYNQSDSILSMSNHDARQEDFIHDNTGRERLISPVNGEKETENDQKFPDSSWSSLQNTPLISARVEDMVHFTNEEGSQNHGVDLLKNSNDFNIPQNISQIQTTRTTEKPQGKTADDDEITYEGDGNDPEPSRTYNSKQISKFTPPLKRTRSQLEGSGTVETNPKDTKRNRPT